MRLNLLTTTLFTICTPRVIAQFFLHSRLETDGKGFEDEISFHLQLQNGSISKALNEGNLNLLDSRKPTKFIIPSWTDGIQTPWIKEMASVMEATNKWNIILVDWVPLSQAIYSEAYEHTSTVAKRLQQFTHLLVSSDKSSFRRIHFIGHGLGAIAAARAAKTILTNSGKLIKRLTALDPSSPPIHGRYKNVPFTGKIAKFTDAIHTNIGGLGWSRSVGDVDFFPNGGMRQPGCGSLICNHVRACHYWTASVINPLAFKAHSEMLRERGVNGQIFPMGMAANPTMPKGTYYVDVSDAPPHVLNDHNIVRRKSDLTVINEK